MEFHFCSLSLYWQAHTHVGQYKFDQLKMRNKQRMSQAQAAQNAKAIAAARSMAATTLNPTMSPTAAPSRSSRTLKGQSRQQVELNPSMQAVASSSMTLPTKQNQRGSNTQFTIASESPIMSKNQTEVRLHERQRKGTMTSMQQKTREMSLRTLQHPSGNSISQQMDGGGGRTPQLLPMPPQVMMGKTFNNTATSKSPNLVRHQRVGASFQRGSSKSSLMHHPRSNSDVYREDLVRGSQSSRQDLGTSALGVTKTRGAATDAVFQRATATPDEEEKTAMLVRRSRVKSMQQSTVQPLFSNALASSRFTSKQKGKLANKDIRGLKSSSLSRLAVAEEASAQAEAAESSAQGLLSRAPSGQPETHIQLLVRVRPILSSETAIQCIQLLKDSSKSGILSSRDCTHGDSSRSLTKKSQGKSVKSEQRMTESQARGSSERGSVIKLVKGYNSVSFKFDQVLQEGCSQETSFQLSSAHIVKNFVAFGSSATIFAYGQTSAGKTYTIIGAGSGSSQKRKEGRTGKKLKISTSEKKGILPRIIDNLFVSPDNQSRTLESVQYIMSFFEIYNDKVYDLLKPPTFSPQNSASVGSKDSQSSRESLEVREQKDGNFVVHNLKKVAVNTRQESYIWLEQGLQNRQVSATSANAASSRSHTIFQIEKVNPQSVNAQTSKLRIVDLAGSEKYCYSNMSQDLKMKELSSINQSLSTLGQCISALGDPQRRHIPFRNCKLTKILRDSLLQPSDLPQSTLVAVIVCISPSVDSYQETQSTLQFADRAKKAILNQAASLALQQPQSLLTSGQNNSSGSLSKLKSVLIDNMASEMEKLRKENAELKSHLRVIRQSNSQGAFNVPGPQAASPVPFEQAKQQQLGQSQKMQDLYQQPQQEMTKQQSSDRQVRESIDLRLSEVFRDDENAVVREVHAEGEVAYKVYRPRQESSPILDPDSREHDPQPQFQLRSCFKGQRAIKNLAVHRKTMASHVIFDQQLNNNDSLNESIRERIEHNLKYNDDTIFDNLEIFQDIGASNNKVHGSKDKFNAKSLLSTPIDEIPVSDEEDEQLEKVPPPSTEKVKYKPKSTNDPLIETVQPQPVVGEAEESKSSGAPLVKQQSERSQQRQIRMSSGDMQEIDAQSNNNVSQLPSFSQSNIQGGTGVNSFMPDMPSLPQIQQDTLNLSNDLSNDLIELGNDKQFQNAFGKDGGDLKPQGMQKPKRELSKDNEPKIFIRDDDFLKFDEDEKQDDSLPLSTSLAFGEQPANLSTLLEQTNPIPKQVELGNDSEIRPQRQVDMFKPQDKLFLNDMSNIMQAEEQTTQKSVDTGHPANQTSGFLGNTIPQALDNQLQSTLILDAEDERDEICRQQAAGSGKNSARVQLKVSAHSSPDEDTIAGLAMLGSSDTKINHRQHNDRSGEQDCMISFDASRISPNHGGGNLDTSHANNNTMLGHLDASTNKAWPNSSSNTLAPLNALGNRDSNLPVVEGDLTDPMEEQLIKPEQIEQSKPMNMLQDVHTGSLFDRNQKKLAAGSLDRVSFDIDDRIKEQADSKLNHEEILAQSLTNTFSTIQSLGGELSALRNNLEMNQQKQQQQQIVQKSGRPARAQEYRHKDVRESSLAGSAKQDRVSKAPVSGNLIPPRQKLQEESKARSGHPSHEKITKRASLKSVLNSGSAKSLKQTDDLLKKEVQKKLVKAQPQQLPPSGARQEVISNFSRPRGAIGGHSSIVPGNYIEQIHEPRDEDESSEEAGVMTDQSLSVDLTTFARDLQGYYSRIHSEIAQLKDILLKSQHDKIQARSAQDNQSEEPLHRQPSQSSQSALGQTTAQFAASQRLNRDNLSQLSQHSAVGKVSQSPQPRRQAIPTAPVDKKINKDAILRAQELIEQIKHEILDGFSKQNSQDGGAGSAFDEQQDRISDPQPHRPHMYFNLTERSAAKNADELVSSRDTQQLAEASSVMTFHPKEHLQQASSDRVLSPLQLGSQEDLLLKQRNTSSINVVSLLQRLQSELLESIPEHRRTTLTGRQKQQIALSAKKLVQKRLDLHPQFEEIEGSQERSPYVVRHMQVQRQNWIRIEDSKPHFGYQKRGDLFGAESQVNSPPLPIFGEQGKKSIEDTDVNLTNTSAAINGDTSNHVIQRPLPVNRIQQKIMKDRTYGLEHQHRAPRPSPEKHENILSDIYSPQKMRSRSGERKESATSPVHGPSLTKRLSGVNQVQGPKITGIGAGSVAADHTLTLIFDSDEEMGQENNTSAVQARDATNQSNFDKFYKANDSKRLSEIVEDYLDEGNATSLHENGNQRASLKSKSVFNDDNSHIVDFPDHAAAVMESQPFERAIEVSERQQTIESRHEREADPVRQCEPYGEEADQHSFMQESSLQNLFPLSARRNNNVGGGMVHLESGMEGTRSQISRPSRFTAGGLGSNILPQFSDNSKPRVSDFNLPIMQVQKQDLSHISDDDLHFFLGIQGQQNQPAQTNASSMVETQSAQPQLEFSLEKRLSTNNLGSFRFNNQQNQALPSDRDLYEIKEIIEKGTPKDSRQAPPLQQRPVEETKKPEAISEAQKWAPPPKLKNLRSKKSKKGRAAQVEPKQEQPLFSARQTIGYIREEVKEEAPNLKVSPTIQQPAKMQNEKPENLLMGLKSSPADRRHKNKPFASDVQARTGNFSNTFPKNFGPMFQKPNTDLLVAQPSQTRPMMQGSGLQATNPQLTQTLVPPLHQSSMEMQDVSHYSENFDEEDYMEQTNNSSSKQSVHKYLFQFFNPSAKLHLQQQQYLASQGNFRKSHSSVQVSPPLGQPGAPIQMAQQPLASSTSQSTLMPTGLAAGIPRSSGKKSPLTRSATATTGGGINIFTQAKKGIVGFVGPPGSGSHHNAPGSTN